MKVGDKVKCIMGSHELTEGDIYTVVKLNSDTGDFKDKDGYVRSGWNQSRFMVVDSKPSIDVLLSEAEKFVGKACSFINSAGVTTRFTPSSVSVFVSHRDAHASSSRVATYFDANGLCVALRGGTTVLPMQEVTIAKDYTTIKLTSDYNADIFKDKVIVGCQTISRALVEEILKNMKALDN